MIFTNTAGENYSMKIIQSIAPVTAIKKIAEINQDEIMKICYPLFKKTPLHYFSYAKMFDTGEMMYFSTHPDLADKLFVKGIYATFEELNLFSSFGMRSTLLSPDLRLPLGPTSAEKYEKMILTAAETSLHYGLFIVDRFSDYYRICGFGSHKYDKSMVNFYFNALPQLERFIPYFEKATSHLIEEYDESNLIFLDLYHTITNQKTIENMASIEVPQMDFLRNKEQQRSGGVIDLLTSREQECLDLISQGFTMKNAARKLDISHRTVEQHLRNVKDKYGLNTKNQLVEFWHELKGEGNI